MGPRRFGRAKHITLKKKFVDFTLGALYSGGWTAVITRAIGLQGRLEVAEHTFRVRRAQADAPVLRIGFVSDLHAGPTIHAKLLEDVFAALADMHADLLLFGGDFVSFSAKNIERIIPRLAA